MSRTFTEDASGFFKSRGRIISWGSRTRTVPFAFDESFPAALRVGCTNAAATLNAVVGREIIGWVDRDWPYHEAPDGKNVISFGRSKVSFPDSHAAETVIFFDEQTSRIVEADIDFDVRHFTFGISGSLEEADVESTCLHEMGHALGLTHVSDRRSMMYPRLTLGVPRRNPSDGDVERLRALYPSEVR